MTDRIVAILHSSSLDAAGNALADFTADAVREVLGPVGRLAHARGYLAAVGRVLPVGERLSTLVRLFLLGQAVDEVEARRALGSLDPMRTPGLFLASVLAASLEVAGEDLVAGLLPLVRDLIARSFLEPEQQPDPVRGSR